MDQDTNYNQDDGYTQRKVKEKVKPAKYVRRKLDFKMMEQTVRKVNLKSSFQDKDAPETSAEAVEPEKDLPVGLILKKKSLKAKERKQTLPSQKPRKKRPCQLCTSAEHTARSCPYRSGMRLVSH
jgi:hypothetical protein